MAGLDQKQIGALALGVLGVGCLLALGREVMHEGSLGESRNPNYGHPSKPAGARSHPAPGFGNMTEEQYYQGLKANRPDLTESQLREKADHWWKVRQGQAAVTGG